MTERELTIGLRLTAAFSAAAMGALVAGGAEGPVRSVVALVFLLLAPGLVVVDIARPRGALEHVVLAVGMSFAIEVAVALGMLYAGVWRPETAVLCLAAFVLAGSAATAIPANARTGAAPVRRRWLIVLAAAGIGVLAGIVLTDGDDGSPVTPPVAPRTVQAGVAQLELPSGWERLARPPALPGLEGGVGVRGASADVVIATLPATRPSLLPEALVAAAGGQVPAPRPLRLGARSAWAYELPGPVPVAAVVSPTTAGVVTLACTGAAGAVPAMDACETAARAVVLVGAAPLEPRPETAAATALPRMIARLNGRRRTARAALAATRSPQRRARAARSVATAYGAAARRIAPLAAGDAAAVRRTLAALAGRYRALAAASAVRLPIESRRAGSAIRRGERRLAGLLRALPPPVGE